uniref:Uncharacterized protein n=1 Tax=Rhizophora mucronata TaxID=61149 RepID=A0A2P2NW21_RHIMU
MHSKTECIRIMQTQNSLAKSRPTKKITKM